MRISATIICLNEQENIVACIESLQKVADEIIVLDSGSTDNTVELAKGAGALVFHQDFLGHIRQKNAAVALAKYDYILSLDADEQLSDELINSINELKYNAHLQAFSMNRLNYFCGKWIRHTGWYPDRKIRLWHRAVGAWGGTNPHDRVIIHDGVEVGWLKGDILHYTYRRREDFDSQSDRFARIAAEAMFKEGRSVGVFPIYFRALFRFVRDYLLKAGFLDGKAGWIISVGNARYTFLKYYLLKQYYRKKG